MIAELKKTQLIPCLGNCAVPRVERGLGARTFVSPGQSRSVWLPLEDETTGESLLHGMIIGAAGAAILYSAALSLDLATSWPTISKWILALLS